MGCIKGKLKAKLEKGNFRCRKCGGCSRFKKDLCKAEYIDYSIPQNTLSEEKPSKEKKKDKKKKKKNKDKKKKQ